MLYKNALVYTNSLVKHLKKKQPKAFTTVKHFRYLASRVFAV